MSLPSSDGLSVPTTGRRADSAGPPRPVYVAALLLGVLLAGQLLILPGLAADWPPATPPR